MVEIKEQRMKEIKSWIDAEAESRLQLTAKAKQEKRAAEKGELLLTLEWSMAKSDLLQTMMTETINHEGPFKMDVANEVRLRSHDQRTHWAQKNAELWRKEKDDMESELMRMKAELAAERMKSQPRLPPPEEAESVITGSQVSMSLMSVPRETISEMVETDQSEPTSASWDLVEQEAKAREDRIPAPAES